jgi:transcriptional regulator with GAF, ATPase, and Fis domain
LAATNRNLEDEVRKGRFREDLYYRLNVLRIVLPPLRARAEDVPMLVRYFVDSFNREFRKKVRGVTDEAMRRLQGYGWPGNVRELRNIVERGMLLSEGTELAADEFLLPSSSLLRQEMQLPGGGIDPDQLERSLVVQALERSGWNQTKAATLLWSESRPDPLPNRQVQARKTRHHVSGVFLPLTARYSPRVAVVLRKLGALLSFRRRTSGICVALPGTDCDCCTGASWSRENA